MTYTVVRQLSRKPPNVPPSLYASYTNNLQLFIEYSLLGISPTSGYYYKPTFRNLVSVPSSYNYLFHIYLHTHFAVNYCNIQQLLFIVSCYLHSLCLFCSSLLTSFLSYFSHCYICFCLVSCIVNLVL
jgi:hypothetical protein